ncbi:unnamed protein product [Urochloa decumbens]|uniref:F-box domain-containing protein n=1 Tax=Urochloa decumbens TaxID=240449 RepID=A0ABC9G9G7_9POAL
MAPVPKQRLSSSKKSRLRCRGRHALEPPTPPSSSSNSRRGQAAPRSMAPVPELMDDLIGEVLLRLPPDDPVGLINATLVCKRWHRIFSDPGFRHRFRELHLHLFPPRMLGGFLCNLTWVSKFVPTSLYLHHAEARRDWRALDARHGRVLLHGVPKDAWTNPLDSGLFVWDPATDHCTEVPSPPRKAYAGCLRTWNATVLCAAAGACDGRRCGRKPFVVVVVGSGAFTCKYSCVYSSSDGEWRNRTYGPRPGDDIAAQWNVEMAMPTALVGRSLYFADRRNKVILIFNLDTQRMNMIPLPPDCHGNRTVLMTTEGGGRLGFATVLLGSKLFLVSGVTSPDGEVVDWDISRVIDLDKLLPAGAYSPFVIGVADDIGVIFLRTYDGGVFTLDLNSGHVKKVYKDTSVYRVVPCVSFKS